MAKSKLQRRKANSRSKYWRNKADKLWGAILHHRQDSCAVCGRTGRLEAHHLISRVVGVMRHDLRNGIILCTQHHKFCTELSAHEAPLQFAEWLQENRWEQYLHCIERKKTVTREHIKPDYRQAYEDLKAIADEEGAEV